MISILLFCVNILACLLVADFMSGVGHWLEDTYGSLELSELWRKYIVVDNLQHHKKPNTILNGSYWDCNKTLIVVALVVIVICVLCLQITAWYVYFTIGLTSQSNHIHRWAHTGKTPTLVKYAQKIGLLQSRQHHAIHHISPYAIRFCTTTNYLNPFLDRIKLWRGLEYCIAKCGVSVKRITISREGV